MSNWLYPLSSTSGRTFVDSDGCDYGDASFESFKKMIRSPATDDWWYLATNFRRVKVGDRIWCYYGQSDRNIGVVGVASVREIRHNEATGEHDIHLKWDKKGTRQLLKTPVPAATVRGFIPRPRAAVQALDPHPRLVETLERASAVSAGGEGDVADAVEFA